MKEEEEESLPDRVGKVLSSGDFLIEVLQTAWDDAAVLVTFGEACHRVGLASTSLSVTHDRS